LSDQLGDAPAVDVGALEPDPWFDNLRVSVNDTIMDAVDAVVERLALDEHLPDWAHEYDRFDRDYGPSAAAGGPIEYWLHNPSFYFEPAQVAAYRIWRGIAAAAEDPGDRLLVVAATHSAPMRAFLAAAIGSDPGEPDNLEEIRVVVEDDRATVITLPASPPGRAKAATTRLRRCSPRARHPARAGRGVGPAPARHRRLSE
jgi:broad specificity phosphatase PhoE